MILLGLLSCRLLPYANPCLCHNRIFLGVDPFSINPALLFRLFVSHLFAVNSHCKFTPLVNLRSLISIVTLFGCLGSVTLTPYF